MGNKFSNGTRLKKGLFLTSFSHFFLITREKTQNSVSRSPFWLFLPYQFCNKKYAFIIYGFSLVRHQVLILIHANWSNLWITKWWAKFKLECLPLIFIYTNNNIVTDDAGSWWLVFVKAKMWFGSGRDYTSLSSSSRSLNLLSVWFCTLILRSWFGVLTFDSNCIFACSFCFFSPTSSKDRWIKKIKKKKIFIYTNSSSKFVVIFCNSAYLMVLKIRITENATQWTRLLYSPGGT